MMPIEESPPGLSEACSSFSPVLNARRWSFYELQVEADPHTIHEHNALVNQILAGNFIFDERSNCPQRENKLYRLGSILLTAQAIEDGKIERIHLKVLWQLRHKRLQLRSKEEVEALRGAFVNRTRTFLECRGISKCHLQYQLFVIEGE